MAQAAYTTDLTTLTENTTNTNMVEPTATTPENWTNLNAVTSAENDFYIQNTTCTSATIKAGVGGLLYNNGAGFTIPTDGAVLTWAYFWGPALLNTTANGGIRTMIGSGTAAFYWVTHGGSDTWTYGGWLCLAMADPSAITVNTVGSPTGTRQYAGWGYNALSAPARGNPYGIDAVRYGRCTIQVTAGDATEYGRFDVIAEFNDKNSTAARTGFTLLNSGYHRLGIFQAIDGGYLWQGRLLLGTSGAAVDFRDSNRSITINNTKHVTANFNLIEVQNASSNVSWTGISIAKVGTVSKGRFLMTDAATVTMTSCTFTDMDTFVFHASGTSNVTGTVFRRCGEITGGSAQFTNCTFDSSTAAKTVIVSTLAKLTTCTFTSDGANHAVDLTTAGSYTWTCTTSGYDAGSTGSPVTPTSTGNETIYVTATTGTVTISVAAGATIPSIRSAGATVNVSSGSVDTFVTVTDVSGNPIQSAQVFLKAKDGTGPLPYDDTVTITRTGSTATATLTAHGLLANDKVVISGATQAEYNGIFTVTAATANTFDYTVSGTPATPATGTIKATYVAISGVTDAAGKTPTMSRVFSADQPVVGWARKASGAPYYKTGPINGTIDSGTGASLTAVLILDQ